MKNGEAEAEKALRLKTEAVRLKAFSQGMKKR
jgi:hypothetical protein